MGLARRGEERHWMPVLPIIRLLGARVRTRDAFVLVEHLHLTVVVHTILLHRSNFLRRTGFSPLPAEAGRRVTQLLSSRARTWIFILPPHRFHARYNFIHHPRHHAFLWPSSIVFFFSLPRFYYGFMTNNRRKNTERTDGWNDLIWRSLISCSSFSFSFSFFLEVGWE